MKKYYNEDDDDDSDQIKNNTERKKFKLKKQNIVFKKKVLRDKKLSSYNKIMLLIKLRVIQGPLFIYSMLECI